MLNPITLVTRAYKRKLGEIITYNELAQVRGTLKEIAINPIEIKKVLMFLLRK